MPLPRQRLFDPGAEGRLTLGKGPLLYYDSGDLLDVLLSVSRSLFEARDSILDGTAHYFSDHARRLMERVAATALDHGSSVIPYPALFKHLPRRSAYRKRNGIGRLAGAAASSYRIVFSPMRPGCSLRSTDPLRSRLRTGGSPLRAV